MIAAVLTFSNCGSDPVEITEEQRVTNLLTQGTSAWAPPAQGGVVVGTVDVTTDLFAGFNIKFSADKTFTTAGTSPVFQRNDTWSFKQGSTTVLIRGSDGKEMTITKVDEDELVFTIEWDQTTTEGGRSKSIEGTHTFTLGK